jgi:hypothetical protein
MATMAWLRCHRTVVLVRNVKQVRYIVVHKSTTNCQRMRIVTVRVLILLVAPLMVTGRHLFHAKVDQFRQSIEYNEQGDLKVI